MLQNLWWSSSACWGRNAHNWLTRSVCGKWHRLCAECQTVCMMDESFLSLIFFPVWLLFCFKYQAACCTFGWQRVRESCMMLSLGLKDQKSIQGCVDKFCDPEHLSVWVLLFAHIQTWELLYAWCSAPHGTQFEVYNVDFHTICVVIKGPKIYFFSISSGTRHCTQCGCDANSTRQFVVQSLPKHLGLSCTWRNFA